MTSGFRHGCAKTNKKTQKKQLKIQKNAFVFVMKDSLIIARCIPQQRNWELKNADKQTNRPTHS